MAAKESPIICVTCQRDFPDDLKAENSPRYFAQYSLLPRTEDAFDFASETQTICEYLKAVADVMRYSDHKEIEDKTLKSIFGLMGELSEEALRRTELTIEAARAVLDREYQAEQATPTQKEGRA
jgi:hypothetical protein